MEKYIHNYTSAAHAQRYLNKAINAFRADEPDLALLYIIQAHSLLAQYLKFDNMIKDNDTYGGWYYAPEVDYGIKFTREHPHPSCEDCRYYLDEGCEFPDNPPCDEPYFF